MSKNVPVDQKLYAQVKRKAKKTFKVWPSAYGSGWLVKEYKRRFAEKHGKRKKPYRVKSKARQSGGGRAEGGLTRWFEEDWRNVCERNRKGEYKKCGRSNASTRAKDYPYCRPLRRVSPKTPKTIKEMTPEERKAMCAKKRRSMKRRSPRRKSPSRVYVKK